MDIEVSRVFRFDGNGAVKAMCDVMLGRQVVIKGFRVVDGKNGLFVGVPREQSKEGKWYDRISFLTDDAKQVVTNTVLKAYEEDGN